MTAQSPPSEPAYEVVWPLGKSRADTRTPQARVVDLGSKTIGELWDYVFHGDRILAILREQLSARFPGIKFLPYEEFGNLHGPEQRELIAAMPGILKARGCDAVISLIGA